MGTVADRMYCELSPLCNSTSFLPSCARRSNLNGKCSSLQDSQGFAINTLVKVDFEPHPLFFRVLALDHSRNELQVLALPDLF